MDNVDFHIAQDDTQPILEATLVDSEKEPKDLTGATARFRMRKLNDTARLIDSSATIMDTSGGVVKYNWINGDTADTGYFEGRFVVDYTGGTGDAFDKDESFPNEGFIIINVTDGF